MTVGMTELPPEGMQLGGVALAGDAERGTKTTEGLSLLFTTAGITVQGPQPQIERLLVWSGLDSAACREKTVLPDGRNAGVMELTSGGQSIRFLLPTESVTPGQAAYLDQALPAWLARYKGAATAAAPTGHVEPDAEALAGGAAMAPSVASEPSADQPVPADQAAPTSFGTAASPEPIDRGLATTPPPPPPPPPGPSFAPPTPPSPTPPPPLAPPTPSFTAPPGTSPLPPPPAPPPAPPLTPPSPTPPPGPSFAPPTPSFTAPPGRSPIPPPPPASPSPDMAAAAAPPVLPPPPEMPAAFRADPPPFTSEEPTGTAGWGAATGPSSEGTAWDNPPLGQVPYVDLAPPVKKAKSWRKARNPEAAPTPPPGAVAPTPPPAAPPKDPVPLTGSTLPPPPPPVAPGAPVVAWGGAGGAGGTGGAATGAPVTAGDATPSLEEQSKRGWRRKGKMATPAAVAAAAAGVVDVERAPAAGGPSVPAIHVVAPVEPQSAPPQPMSQAPTTDMTTNISSFTGSPLSAPDAPAAEVLTDPSATGEDSVPASASPKESKGKRSTVVLLLVLLLVVIGAIAYVAAKRNNNNTTTNPVTPTSTVPVSADSALATSINLGLSDLPAGWVQSPASGQMARPPVAPAAAQVQAERALAVCLGSDFSEVAGLFGGSVLPGQTDSVRSPTFQSGSDPTIQMYSATAVMSTAAQAHLLTTVFTNPNLPTCLTQYQSAVVSAAVPGATATIQVVTLDAPPGVSTFGYLSTLSIPNQGSEVIGQGFMVAGRIEAKLEPTTAGAAVPSDAFVPAYNAVVGRVAAAAGK